MRATNSLKHILQCDRCHRRAPDRHQRSFIRDKIESGLLLLRIIKPFQCIDVEVGERSVKQMPSVEGADVDDTTRQIEYRRLERLALTFVQGAVVAEGSSGDQREEYAIIIRQSLLINVFSTRPHLCRTFWIPNAFRSQHQFVSRQCQTIPKVVLCRVRLVRVKKSTQSRTHHRRSNFPLLHGCCRFFGHYPIIICDVLPIVEDLHADTAHERHP